MGRPKKVWEPLPPIWEAPDDYAAGSGRTLTMTGPKDGSRSANGMGGTRAVG